MDRRSSCLLLVAVMVSLCLRSPAQGDEATAPRALAELVAAHQATVKTIQDRAREELAAEQARMLAALRELREQFVKEGKGAEADVVAAEIRRIDAHGVDGVARAAVPPPASPAQWRGRTGESYFCELTGAIASSVWGTDVYTDDSDLATAAVHAGALKVGETGVVKITIAAPLDSYPGSARNGVDTTAWGNWGGAFTIQRAKDADLPPTPMGDGAAIANPGSLSTLAQRAGDVFLIDLIGSEEGFVWGTDVYTTDSALAAAAVHAGVLKVGERGVVKVIVVEGQGDYASTSRNGVATRPWGSYSLSYRFAKAE